MRLLEQLQLMRQLGIEEGDEALTQRLQKVGYDVERAVSDFYETSSRNVSAPPPPIDTGRSNQRKRSRQKHSSTAFSNCSPRSSKLVAAIPARQYSFKTAPDKVKTWLLGRRVTIGYTLNAGFALREMPLRLKFEGVLSNQQSSAGRKDKVQENQSTTKKKMKFSAANLMFECDPPRDQPHSSSNTIQGRFSNLICNFLVPLLQSDMIRVTGHIAFDYGEIGLFQDLPLSLQIHVTSKFWNVLSRDNDSVSGTQAVLSSSQLKEKERLKTTAKAGNELLIWLTEGEEALRASRVFDKNLSDYSEKFAPESPSNKDDESVDVTHPDLGSKSPEKITTEVMGTPKRISLKSAQQPSLIKGIQLKKYQLQALQWMVDRERDECQLSEGINLFKERKMDDAEFIEERRKIVVIDDDSDGDNLNAPAESCLNATLTTCSNTSDIFLPIEGVIAAPLATNTILPPFVSPEQDLTSLWIPLFCLQSAQSLDCLDTVSKDVNFYSANDIAKIIHHHPSDEAVIVLWWNRYTQTVSCVRPQPLAQCRGGILADQMGLGKTIMSIALIVSDFEMRSTLRAHNKEDITEDSSVRDSSPAGSTLIVCPLSLMSQWMDEFKNKVCKPGAVRVMMYYGSGRDKTQLSQKGLVSTERNQIFGDEASSCIGSIADVVITSYGVLTSEWRRDSSGALAPRNNHQSTLLKREWHRVILDEGHTIRNPATDTARACHSIIAVRRWILSGTPVQNKIDDLYSLLKFLKHQPWDKWRWWYTTISLPIQHANNAQETCKFNSNMISSSKVSSEISSPAAATYNEGITVVQKLLSTLMLRRTKETVDTETGQCIVSLPPRDVKYIYIDLEPAEKSFYNALAKRSTTQMLEIMSRQSSIKKGHSSIKDRSALTGYAELFTLLMRLRQTCDHPILVLKSFLEKQSLQQLLSGNQTTVSDDESSSANNDDNLKSMKAIGKMEKIKEKLLKPVSSLYLDDVLKSLEHSWQNLAYPNGHVNSFSSSSQAPVRIEQQECCVCFEYMTSPDDTAITPCGHILCWDCATLSVEKNSSCPVCMTEMDCKELISLGDKRLNDNINKPAITNDKTSRNAHKTCSTSTGKAGPLRSFLTSNCNESDKGRRENKVTEIFPNLVEGINWQMSSKLLALQNELEKIFSPLHHEQDLLKEDQIDDLNKHKNQMHPKVVIFSQWTGMLDLVETMIQTMIKMSRQDSYACSKRKYAETECDIVDSSSKTEKSEVLGANSSAKGIRTSKSSTQTTTDSLENKWNLSHECWVRFDGSMSQSQRSLALRRFSSDPQARLLLISLKAGGVGLNLTAASYLFLLDPWWNPAVEDQAIDRVHRLGQMHTVKIMRMVCRDTVEEKLIALQASKRRMSQQALSSNTGDERDETETFGENKGANKLSLEELKSLFM